MILLLEKSKSYKPLLWKANGKVRAFETNGGINSTAVTLSCRLNRSNPFAATFQYKIIVQYIHIIKNRSLLFIKSIDQCWVVRIYWNERKSEISLKTKEVKLQRLIICSFQRYIYSEYKCGKALECLDETNSQPQRNQYWGDDWIQV